MFNVAASEKKVFLNSRFNLCKTCIKGSYFNNIAGIFLTTFSTMNTLADVFRRFDLDIKQFCIVLNISRRPSHGEFCNF